MNPLELSSLVSLKSESLERTPSSNRLIQGAQKAQLGSHDQDDSSQTHCNGGADRSNLEEHIDFPSCPGEFTQFIESTSLERLVYWKLQKLIDNLSLDVAEGMQQTLFGAISPVSPFGLLVVEAFDRGMTVSGWIGFYRYPDPRVIAALGDIWRKEVWPAFTAHFGIA